MPDKSTRGVSNLPVAIPDIPDAPTVSAVNAGTSRAYNNGAATVTISSPTGGLPSSYSIATTPITSTTTATSSPATITGLASATSYTTTVTPTNVSATGSATTSSAFTATTIPQAPTIGATTVATGQAYSGSANVSVAFTAGATGGSAITTYTATSSSGNTATGATSPISVSDTVAVARTYTVTATNANGNSVASAASASTTPLSVPQAPTIGTPVAGTDASTQVSVPFTAGATGGSAITGYTVTSSPGSLTGTGASSPIVVSGLTAETAYTFTMTATNAQGNSAASSASSSITTSKPLYWLELLSGLAIYVNPYPIGITSVGTTTYTLNQDWPGAGDPNARNGIIKRDTYSTISLQKALRNNAAVYSQVYGIAVDSSGNIYTGGGGNGSPKNAYLMKTDSSGAVTWAYYTSPDQSYNYNYTLALDSSAANIHAISSAYKAASISYAQITKYNSSGVKQWSRKLSNNLSITYPHVDFNGGYVDSSGNVIGVGRYYLNDSYQLNVIWVKYNSSGTIQWQRAMSPPSLINSYYTQAVGDSSGNTYTSWSAGDFGYLSKHDSSGTLQWQRKVSMTGSGNAAGFEGIAMDSSGNLYVSGYVTISSQKSVLLIKYNSSGTLQWQNKFTRSSGNLSQASGRTLLTVDTNNDITVTSASGDTNEIYTFKVPTDGTKTGTKTLGAYSITYGTASTTDAAGNYGTATPTFTDSAGDGATTAITVTSTTTAYTSASVGLS